METNPFLPLITESAQALVPYYRPGMQKAIADAGLEPPEWNLLFVVRSYEPEAVDARRLAGDLRYSAVSQQQERLARAAEQGYLSAHDGGYHLTEQGRRAIELAFEAAHAALGPLGPLPDEEMQRLATLLRRLVRAVEENPEPAEKLKLRRSRSVDPGDDAPSAVRIDQYLTDLLFFRDDAHEAAWTPYGAPGHTWETLTLLWRGEAQTLDELCERLQGRGHTRESYAACLKDLVGRGWVEKVDGAYRVTEEGRAIRQEAEDATDRTFYAPWSALNEAETEELQTSLLHFKEALSTPEGSAAA